MKVVVIMMGLIWSSLVFGAKSNPAGDLSLSDLDTYTISPIQLDGKLQPTSADPLKLSNHYKGKWVILDVSATWCPYCKLDQIFFVSQKNTINEYTINKELWSQDVVQVHLNVESKAPGARQQTKESILKFLQPQSIAKDKNLKGLNRQNIDTLLLHDLDREGIKVAKAKNGQLLFKDFQGYPYQMVFNPKGKLVFQGNFTSKIEGDGDDWTKPYRRHYEMLTKLMTEKN